MSEHLQHLRRIGLVAEQALGRERHYHLVASPLTQVASWLHPFERYWRDRLRTLADVLEEDPT